VKSNVPPNLEKISAGYQLISGCVIGPYWFFSGAPLDWSGDECDMVWWIGHHNAWLQTESYGSLEQ
jgi:hypothetical protein